MVEPAELHYHEAVVDYLGAMIDPHQRAQLGATEAFCIWYDHLYAPADNPALYNPGVFERALREWRSCFSEPELAAMAEFHAYFETMEPPEFDVRRPWAEIEDDPRWRGLVAAASKAFHAFNATI